MERSKWKAIQEARQKDDEVSRESLCAASPLGVA
jgi:hypothetical protein